MLSESSARLLDETRALLQSARELVVGGREPVAELGRPQADRASVLGLYEALRKRLESIDDERLAELLTRLSGQVDRLNGLGGDIERIKRLRSAIRRSSAP